MNGTTVLVTGGAGYVGSQCCKALAAAGYIPVTYDNLSTGHRELVRWGPFEAGDIRDGGRLDEVFRRHAPSAVLHFAAAAYVEESARDPLKYFDNNVGGTISLLRAAVRHGVRRMVFSSSCAVYGAAPELPVGEGAPTAPASAYGETKLICEWMLRREAEAGSLSYFALRYFNAAGADPDGETGEWHDPETHLLPRAILAGLGELPELTLFGTDHATPDGTAVRDYIHVADLADAHVRALRDLEDGGPSRALNLGTGRGYSVREIVDAVEAAVGRPLAVRIAAKRPGDPPAVYADARLAGEVLGFAPRHSDIATIIGTALAWHRKRAGGQI
jgi:UDP-arabinose 4-epimerase